MPRALIGGPVFLLFLLPQCIQADNWPAWRGPLGNSVSTEHNLPLVWNSARGVAWKTEIPGWGTSTPAIWDKWLFVTSQRERDLLLHKLDKATGQIVWTKTVGQGDVARAPLQKKSDTERQSQKFHELHNLASPSPVTNGQVVVAHFGNGDLAAFDYDGNQLWQRNLQADHGPYTIWWGHANSPVIYGDTVISVCMQDNLAGTDAPPAASYLVAHDLRTGDVRWHTPRATQATAEECDSYTTPLLRQVGDRVELLLMGGNQLDAYDPRTGGRLWAIPGLTGGRTVTGPTLHGDTFGQFVTTTIGMKGPMLTFKLPAADKPLSGEQNKGKMTAWRHDKGTADSASPVVWENLLFYVTDDGIARAFDSQTGQPKWQERLPGQYKASPLAADGRVYFVNQSGLTTVLAAGTRFEKLVENQLDDQFIASPAVSEGRIYLRGKQALWCVGKE